MEKRAGGRKSLGVVLVATLLVVLAILLVFFYQTQESHRDGIVLPTAPSGDASQGDQEEGAVLPFLTVAPENVANVIGTMERPVAYGQQVELTTYYSGGSGTQKVTTWQNGDLIKAVIEGEFATKHLLTQGEKVWLWYGGDTTSAVFTVSDEITFENLLAVPTYETVAKLPAKEIVVGEFVTDDTGSYLNVETGTLQQKMDFTIDTTTQLLVSAKGWVNGTQTMELSQTSFEILSPQDEIFTTLWWTPEGVDVSAGEEN